MKLRSILTVAAAILSLALAQSARANLVVNGDFSTGDFTGWTQTGNTGFSGVSGSFAIFGPVGSVGGIQQTIATTISQSYYLSFDLQNVGGTPNEFSVSINGNDLFNATNLPAFGWTSYGFNFVAGSASSILQFNFRQDPSYFYLDNVSVPDSTATLGLLLVSLVGIVGLRRKFV